MASSEAVRSMLRDLERRERVELSPVARLLLATDGTVTHMLEALTGQHVTIDILGRDVSGTTLHRTVALEGAGSGEQLVWARSEIDLSLLEKEIADALVNGDIGIGDLLFDECTETRREIVDMGAVFHENGGFPPFVDSDAAYLFQRRYRIYDNGDRIMTITEYFPETLF